MGTERERKMLLRGSDATDLTHLLRETVFLLLVLGRNMPETLHGMYLVYLHFKRKSSTALPVCE